MPSDSAFRTPQRSLAEGYTVEAMTFYHQDTTPLHLDHRISCPGLYLLLLPFPYIQCPLLSLCLSLSLAVSLSHTFAFLMKDGQS